VLPGSGNESAFLHLDEPPNAKLIEYEAASRAAAWLASRYRTQRYLLWTILFVAGVGTLSLVTDAPLKTFVLIGILAAGSFFARTRLVLERLTVGGVRVSLTAAGLKESRLALTVIDEGPLVEALVLHLEHPAGCLELVGPDAARAVGHVLRLLNGKGVSHDVGLAAAARIVLAGGARSWLTSLVGTEGVRLGDLSRADRVALEIALLIPAAMDEVSGSRASLSMMLQREEAAARQFEEDLRGG
jgi:hypothetical protein